MSRVSPFKVKENEDAQNILVDDISDSISKKIIYIYNVADIDHPVNRPPNFPRMFWKACPLDKDYIQVGSVEDPYPQIIYRAEDGKPYINYVDGIREVCRLMCSMNPNNKSTCKNTKDIIAAQDFILNNENYSNDNYNELGIFWSFNNPPTKEEVDAAIKRLEKTYRNELLRMTRAELDNPKEASLAANTISKRAADYFDESPSWHNTKYYKSAKVAVEANKTYKVCPECGHDDIPEIARKCFYPGCGWRFDSVAELTPLEKARAAKAAKAAATA